MKLMEINKKYVVIKKLSETIANTVYLAKDKKTNKKTVVKLLKDNSESAILQFKKEFSILHSLNHHGIVKVCEFNHFRKKDKISYYFTMEYIENGEAFNSYFQTRGLSNFPALFKELLETMGYIHSRGFIHGDLKPNHIIVTPQNDIKIVDFGYAQIKNKISESDIGGTLEYIAPELLRGKMPDERSDIYSLGIIAYESVSALHPFKHSDIKGLIKSKLTTNINKNAFVTKDIPGYLKDVIRKMSDKEPINRFKDITEILEYINNEGNITKQIVKIKKILNTPFVGRKKFTNYTKRVINDRERNQGAIVIFEGEEGIGKTAILREFEYAFLGSNVETQFIDLYNYFDKTPDWIIDILRSADIPVMDIIDMIEKGEFTFTGMDKYKFYDIIVEKLLHLPADKKYLFLIDNLSGDNPFFDFISYVANYLNKVNAYFVFTTPKIPDRLHSIMRNKVFENVTLFELKKLTKYETKTIVANMLGIKENVDELSNYIYKISQGIPHLIIEHLKGIVKEGVISKEQGNLVYNIVEIRKIALPSTIREIYKQNLLDLNEDSVDILEAMAIYKYPIAYNTLKELSNLTDLKVARTIENSSLKNYISYGLERLFFTNDTFRMYVYESIPEKKRSKIHNKIISLFKEKRESIYNLKVLSYNALAIKSPEAKEYLLKLINLAQKHNKLHEATDTFVELYKNDCEYAINNIKENIIINIGNYLSNMGKYNLSRDIFSKLFKKTKSDNEKAQITKFILMIKMLIGDTNNLEADYNRTLNLKLSVDRRFETLLDFGWYYYTKGNVKKAEKMYHTAQSISDKLSNKLLYGKLLYNMAVLKMSVKRLDESFDYAEELVKFAKANEHKGYTYAGMNLIANIFQYKREYLLAVQHYKDLLKMMGESVDIERKLRILINLARMFFQVGKIKESKSYYYKAIVEARKMEKPYDIAVLYNLFGSVLMKEGHWNDALGFLKKSQNISEELNKTKLQKDNIILMLNIYGYRGEIRELDSLIEKTREIAGRVKSLRDKISMDLIFGTYHYINKNYDDALIYLNTVVDSIEKTRLPEYQVPALILKTKIKLDMDMLTQAKKPLEKADSIVKEKGLLIYEDEIEYIKILIFIDSSEKNELKKRFKKLIEKTRNNDKFLYAQILIEYAEFLKRNYLSTGYVNIMKLINILEEARIIFENLGGREDIISINNELIDLYKKVSVGENNVVSYDYGDIISEFINIIKSIEDPEKLESSFINLAKKFTGAERGLFISFDKETGELYTIGKDLDKTTEEDVKKISHSIINKAAYRKEPIIVSDALIDRKFNRFESIKLNKIHSILCVPVVSNEDVWGVLYLDSRRRVGIFSDNEKQLFNLLAILLAKTLENSAEYSRIREESMILKESLRIKFGPEILVGKSKKMQEIYDKIEKFAKSDVPVLILGESGTGKEITAKNIHYLSSRKDNNFLLIDCSSLSQSLIESELFGYKKGAFTGAKEDKIGHFEAADKGTLFIDEISNASESLQARLLRFLDTHEVKRIGTTRYKKVDTRTIIASNTELYELVKMGKFRSDLFFRLSRFVITLPPLRERKEDIRLLIDYFIDLFNKRYNKKIKGVNEEAFKILYGYNWPGNVRELKNEIDKCVFFCNERYITPRYISGDIKNEENIFLPLREMKIKLVKNYVDTALKFTNGDVTKAARLLKTDKATLYRYKKK